MYVYMYIVHIECTCTCIPYAHMYMYSICTFYMYMYIVNESTCSIQYVFSYRALYSCVYCIEHVLYTVCVFLSVALQLRRGERTRNEME